MVTTLTALFVVTTSILLSTGYAQAEEGKLLFRSGFEPNVYVTRDYHDIRGADGMDWQRHLEERISYAHRFTLNYCAEAPTFAWARIIDDPTSGGRGRVLHMSVVTTVGTSRSTSTISSTGAVFLQTCCCSTQTSEGQQGPDVDGDDRGRVQVHGGTRCRENGITDGCFATRLP